MDFMSRVVKRANWQEKMELAVLLAEVFWTDKTIQAIIEKGEAEEEISLVYVRNQAAITFTITQCSGSKLRTAEHAEEINQIRFHPKAALRMNQIRPQASPTETGLWMRLVLRAFS